MSQLPAPDAATFNAELARAVRALSRADPLLGRHIARVGPCGLERSTRFVPFQALLSTIIHQQLNGTAAGAILARVKARVGDGGWPSARRVAATRFSTLRACGLSRAKAVSLQDLATRVIERTVPSAAQLHRMSNESIIERLTVIRGVGRWTVEMMLMFRLGRLDVLPVEDFGVRKGYAMLRGLPSVVSPQELRVAGERWSPYRSVASWYLWRVLDD